MRGFPASFVGVTGFAYIIIGSIVTFVYGLRSDNVVDFILLVFVGVGCLFVVMNIIILITKLYRKKIRKRVGVIEKENLKKFENIKNYGYENIGGSCWQNWR